MVTARIAVVEDDATAANTLCGYIDRYCGENGGEFDVRTFTCIATLLTEYRNDYDILLMDVELPDGNGIDAVKQIREKDDDVIVVFITNMAQFAVRGYEVRAMDYVIKPVSYYNFAAKFGAALTALDKRRETFIWISNKDGKTRLNASLVTYVGEIDKNIGASIEFNVEATRDGTASLIIYVTRRAKDIIVTRNIMVQVNGKEIETKAIVPNADGKDDWYTFVPVNLGCIDLDQGANTIIFTVISTDNYSGFNFDKIELLGDHECTQKCETCGKCLDAECEEDTCADKCAVEHGTAYKFEAESAALKRGTKPLTTVESGDRTVVTGLNGNRGASLAYTVYSVGKTTANLTVSVAKGASGYKFTDAYAVTVNYEKFGTVAKLSTDGTGEFAEINLGCVNLNDGRNIITFATVNDGSASTDFDYIKITSETALSVTPPDGYAEPVAYRFEGEQSVKKNGTKNISTGEYYGTPMAGNLSANTGASLTFEFYSELDTTAQFVVALVPTSADTKVTDVFDITVNGTPYSSDAIVSGAAGARAAVETVLGNIDLKDGTDNGKNTIVFTVKEGTTGFNYLDYIIIESTAYISSEYLEPTPEGHIHTYSSEWTFDGNYHWHAATCDHTFKVKDRAAHTYDSDDICTVCGSGEREFIYEAEDTTMIAGSAGYLSSQGGGSGTVVGNVNKNLGASFEFAVNAPKDCTQKLYIRITRRAFSGSPIDIDDSLTIEINGVAYTTAATTLVPDTSAESTDKTGWNTYDDILLGDVSLKQGLNIFKFTVKTNQEKLFNFDYFKFLGGAALTAVDLNTQFVVSTQRFEAENATMFGGAKRDGTATDKDGNTSGKVGSINDAAGSGVKFTVTNVGAAKKVKLIVAVTKRSASYVKAFGEVFSVALNESSLTVNGNVPTHVDGEKMWYVSGEVELCEIELAADTEYTITFTVLEANKSYACNFDYIKLAEVAA